MRAAQQALVVSMAIAVVLLAGCQADTRECDGDCPPIADTFSIYRNSAFGQCGFLPAALPPSLEVRESSDGRSAFVTVLDPVLLLSIDIPLQVFVAEDPDEELIAALYGLVYTSRPPQLGSDRVIELQYRFNASIGPGEDGRREIFGSLNTSGTLGPADFDDPDAPDGGSGWCTQTISFSGFSTGQAIAR